MDEQPLDEVQWRAPEWIQMYGLRTDNVLEYFSQSPFYDRASNNQALKMQSQFNQNMHGRPDLYKELQNMVGVEFVVYMADEPNMWIIRKQERLSPTDVRYLATYFVIGENIYQAPSIYSVINARLLSTTLALKQALNKAVTLPTYSPSQGYSYITDESALAAESSSKKPPQPTKSQYSTPIPSQTPASQSSNINNNIPIPPVDEYKNTVYMERALMFTHSNTTKYIDDEAEVKPDKPLDTYSRVNTPQAVTSPSMQKRRRK